MAHNEQARTIAYTSSGNIMILGDTYADANKEVYLANYNPAGAVLWQKSITLPSPHSFPTGSSIEGMSLAVDSNQNTTIAISVGNATVHSSQLMQFDSGGGLLWQTTVGPVTSSSAMGIIDLATDVSNNIFALGYDDGVTEAYLFKFNSFGTLQWQNKFTDAEGYSLTTNTNGNVIVSGIDVGTIFGYSGMYLADFSNNGVLQWKKFLKANYTVKSAVTTDANNNIYALLDSLEYSGEISLLVKYNSVGTMLWQVNIATINPAGVTCDSNNDIYVCGDGDPLVGTNADVCIIKFGAGGNTLWQRRFGSNRSDSVTDSPSSKAIAVRGNTYSVIASSVSSLAEFNILTFQMPTDGSNMGSWGNYIYGGGVLGFSAGPLVNEACNLTNVAATIPTNSYTLSVANSNVSVSTTQTQ